MSRREVVPCGPSWDVDAASRIVAITLFQPENAEMMRTKTFSFALTLLCGACAGQQADKAPADPEPASAPAQPATAVDPIPEGWFELTPQLAVEDVDAATTFYEQAFGAQKVYALAGPDGRTMHAEIKIGDSFIMLDRAGDEGMPSPKKLGGSPVTLMVYVANADETVKSAMDAGAQVTMPLEDQFWGDRYGELNDPFGHRWAVATNIENVTDEQMKQRAELVQAEMAKMAETAKNPKSKKAKEQSKKPAKAQPAWKSVESTPAKSPIPPNYHTVTMAIVVPDANAAISFYEQAFGATLVDRMDMPSGKVMHAEVKVGNTSLMMSDEMPEWGTRSAASLGGSPVNIHHYVEDADAVFAKATGLGAQVAYPLGDAAWGDRYGAVVDPTGLPWGIATHTEDLTPEQIDERMKAMMEAEQAAAMAEPAAGEAAPAK